MVTPWNPRYSCSLRCSLRLSRTVGADPRLRVHHEVVRAAEHRPMMHPLGLKPRLQLQPSLRMTLSGLSSNCFCITRSSAQRKHWPMMHSLGLKPRHSFSPACARPCLASCRRVSMCVSSVLRSTPFVMRSAGFCSPLTLVYCTSPDSSFSWIQIHSLFQ